MGNFHDCDHCDCEDCECACHKRPSTTLPNRCPLDDERVRELADDSVGEDGTVWLHRVERSIRTAATKAAQDAKAEEREACAVTAERYAALVNSVLTESEQRCKRMIAHAIRSRGEGEG